MAANATAPVGALPLPLFVKPLVPKLFTAAVYDDLKHPGFGDCSGYGVTGSGAGAC